MDELYIVTKSDEMLFDENTPLPPPDTYGAEWVVCEARTPSLARDYFELAECGEIDPHEELRQYTAVFHAGPAVDRLVRHLKAGEAERLAKEDVAESIQYWRDRAEKLWPLTAEVARPYVDEEYPPRQMPEYWAALQRELEDRIEEVRSEYAGRAAQYWVARRGLPGSHYFEYEVCASEEEAQTLVDKWRSEASSQAELEAARQGSVIRGSECLWDVWANGRLIYRRLFEVI
jgi:hypothetical protein